MSIDGALERAKHKSRVWNTKKHEGKRMFSVNCSPEGINKTSTHYLFKNVKLRTNTLLSNTFYKVERCYMMKMKNSSKYAAISLLSKASRSTKGSKFILDSGASGHMINNRQPMINFKENVEDYFDDSYVYTADGSKVAILGIGDIPCRIGNNHYLVLKDVLYVPTLEDNLISTVK
jgi:hypothetical protein